MNRYSSYFHYWFSAKKRHNIHSPFVYELSDKCLTTPLKNSDKQIIDKQFQALSKDQTSITISDFGAGSKVMGNERKIRDIFKNSRSSEKYAHLLYRLSAYYQPKRVLEFGTSLAWGTLHLHLGNPKAKIDTVEGCPKTFDKAKSLFPVNAENVHFHNSVFEVFLNNLKDETYDLIFIDGNHRGQAMLTYIEQLLPFSNHNTIWLLDDIRWSDDMWQAWEQIVKDERFHVTIDFMRMGIALRRETQEKEPFSLRL
jgi:predicted O-methyltransferase YrrM